MNIWYIYANNIVSGPFSAENIELGLKQNKWPMESLVWWKGQREWISLESWRKDLNSILTVLKTNVQTAAWYIEYLGAQKGPMNVKELENFIHSQRIAGSSRVWSEGMDRWMNIFEIPELINHFGLTRRKYPRAPITAEVIIETPTQHDKAIVGSIGLGGMGVKGLSAVKIGETLVLNLNTSLLSHPIKSTAKVVYTNIGGYTGLKFNHLKKDFASVINHYINQFKP